MQRGGGAEQAQGAFAIAFGRGNGGQPFQRFGDDRRIEVAADDSKAFDVTGTSQIMLAPVDRQIAKVGQAPGLAGGAIQAPPDGQ